MPTFSDFIALAAVINPVWIFVGSALGLHGLWRWPMTRGHMALCGGWALMTVLLVGGSWYVGAQQVASNRIQEEANSKLVSEQKETHDSVKNIAEMMNIQSGISTADILSKIKRSLGPRFIDPMDATAVANQLHGSGSYKFHLSVLSQDRETLAFAQQLANIMSLAGWVFDGASQDFTPGISDVVISCATKETLPSAFKALTESLTKVGVTLNDDRSCNSFAPQGDVEVFIGPKG